MSTTAGILLSDFGIVIVPASFVPSRELVKYMSFSEYFFDTHALISVTNAKHNIISLIIFKIRYKKGVVKAGFQLMRTVKIRELIHKVEFSNRYYRLLKLLNGFILDFL